MAPSSASVVTSPFGRNEKAGGVNRREGVKGQRESPVRGGIVMIANRRSRSSPNREMAPLAGLYGRKFHVPAADATGYFIAPCRARGIPGGAWSGPFSISAAFRGWLHAAAHMPEYLRKTVSPKATRVRQRA